MQQLPRFEEYEDTPIYNTQAVVRMTAVQAPRLRAWERRYTLLSPQRNTNSYRLYSERDVAIIRWLSEQVDKGMTISQATAYLREMARMPASMRPPATPMPPLDMSSLMVAIIAAVKRLDEAQTCALLQQAFAVYPVEDVCNNLITPAMVEIGHQWETDGHIVVAEHFFSGIVRAQLDALWHATYHMTDGPLVVVGTAPGDLHDLGALMLALFLRRAGIRATFLGANLPATDIVWLAQMLHPTAICLISTYSACVPVALDLVDDLAAIAGLKIFLSGRALTPEVVATMPAHVQYMHQDGLQAVAVIKRALITR